MIWVGTRVIMPYKCTLESLSCMKIPQSFLVVHEIAQFMLATLLVVLIYVLIYVFHASFTEG